MPRAHDAATDIDPRAQRAYFETADRRHLAWQLGPGTFADSERRLIEAAAIPAGDLLEIGCGCGANLAHLARPRMIGIDSSRPRVALARRTLPGAAWAVADAAALPFASGAFDAVLVRDLLHHVPDRRRVVAEAARVLRPGGTLVVIEPNRRSPLIVAQARLVPAERGALGSDAGRLRADLAATDLVEVTLEHAQPLPLARVLTHPALGLDALSRSRLLGRLFAALDAAAARVVPRAAWLYLVARARKPGV